VTNVTFEVVQREYAKLRPQLPRFCGCETCRGAGTIAVDMQFLPDVVTTCPDCHGTRYRREVLDACAVGGEVLDEDMALWACDADLAWRARGAGWRCVLAPAAVAYHHHSPSLGHASSAKHLLVGRNRVRLLARNASRRQLRRRLLRIVAYDLLYVGYAGLTERTTAPLTGRIRGLRGWHADRDRAPRDVPLSPPPGLRAALRRNRAYRAGAAR